jgi:hypothetical protein
MSSYAPPDISIVTLVTLVACVCNDTIISDSSSDTLISCTRCLCYDDGARTLAYFRLLRVSAVRFAKAGTGRQVGTLTGKHIGR